MIPCAHCHGLSYTGIDRFSEQRPGADFDKERCPLCWGWGILFKAPMVRAILAGAKTETRRLNLSWLKRRKGDRLWVRETWAPAGVVGDEVEYRADNPDPTTSKWRTPLHMPRSASRILLELTADARKERVQDIDERGGIAEGFASRAHFLDAFCAMHDVELAREIAVIPFKVLHPVVPRIFLLNEQHEVR